MRLRLAWKSTGAKPSTRVNSLSRVFLGLGSNYQAPQNISLALDALAAHYGALKISSVYQSEPVGFTGRYFLNLVVGLETDESIPALSAWIKKLENRLGRRRDGSSPTKLTLDVDLLTYDAVAGTVAGVELPRTEILQNAFVLQPLAEIAGDEVHPEAGQTYRELWRQFSGPQKLWVVPFDWAGKRVSPRAGITLDV